MPEIDGIAQSDGREFSAENTAASETGFSMDMEKAYAHPKLKHLKRSFDVGERGVIICDSYAFDDEKEHNICERFVSLEEPEITPNGVKIGNFLLKCRHTPQLARGTVKHHTTYQPETLYFTEYTGDFREFVLEIVLEKK